MSKHIMVVAELFKLGRDENGFTKDFKTSIRSKGVVPRSQVKRINDQFEDCGKWYEVDEEETEKRFAEGEKKTAEIRQAQEDSDALGKVMADTLKSVKKPKPKKDSTPEVNEELEAARERYAELNDGKRPHHATKLSTINEFIAEKEAELNN